MRLRFGYRKEVWAWGLHEDLYREYKEKRVGRRGRVGGGGTDSLQNIFGTRHYVHKVLSRVIQCISILNEQIF